MQNENYLNGLIKEKEESAVRALYTARLARILRMLQGCNETDRVEENTAVATEVFNFLQKIFGEDKVISRDGKTTRNRDPRETSRSNLSFTTTTTSYKHMYFRLAADIFLCVTLKRTAKGITRGDRHQYDTPMYTLSFIMYTPQAINDNSIPYIYTSTSRENLSNILKTELSSSMQEEKGVAYAKK